MDTPKFLDYVVDKAVVRKVLNDEFVPIYRILPNYRNTESAGRPAGTSGQRYLHRVHICLYIVL